jgi:hypothetical protein
MSNGLSGQHDGSWHPPLALRRHGFRWLFAPLIAFAVFDVGPSVLAPILFILSFFVDLGALASRLDRAPGLIIALLVEPFVLTIGLWPFLALYSAARGILIERPAGWRSIRLATIASTIAMSLPSTVLLLDASGEMVSTARDAGQGTGILLFLFLLLLPILGIFGWGIGRGIAWVLRY